MQPSFPEATFEVPDDLVERPGRNVTGVHGDRGHTLPATHGQMRTGLADFDAAADGGSCVSSGPSPN